MADKKGVFMKKNEGKAKKGKGKIKEKYFLSIPGDVKKSALMKTMGEKA